MMEINQRCKIEQMRSSGASYSSIAAALNLSINTVKSHCRRNKIKKEAISDNTICSNCGGQITQKVGSKKRRFCSDKCRKAFWKAHPEQLNKKALYPTTCVHCGAIFLSYGNKNRKFCSHPCYISTRFGNVPLL